MASKIRAGGASHGLRLRRKVKRTTVGHAQRMREKPTPAEAALWERLRGVRLGVKFRQQAIIRGFIADFWCPKLKLVVEVDGDYHLSPEQAAKDAHRDAAMRQLGITVLRFRNAEVLGDIDRVCASIFNTVVALTRRTRT